MRFLHDVRYEDVPPSADFLEAHDLVMAAVLTKPTCWAYEQEVRLIKQEGNQLADVPPDAIKELILGARSCHGNRRQTPVYRHETESRPNAAPKGGLWREAAVDD